MKKLFKKSGLAYWGIFWLIMTSVIALLALFVIPEPIEPTKVTKPSIELYSISQKVTYHESSNRWSSSGYWYKDSVYLITTPAHLLLTTQLLKRDTLFTYTLCYDDIKSFRDTITIETADSIKCWRYYQARDLMDELEYIDGITCDGYYFIAWKNDTISLKSKGQKNYHFKSGYLRADHLDIIRIDSTETKTH